MNSDENMQVNKFYRLIVFLDYRCCDSAYCLGLGKRISFKIIVSFIEFDYCNATFKRIVRP